jgi:hypothetical protein
MAYDKAFQARNVSESTRDDLEGLLNEISRVIGAQRATPKEVEQVSKGHPFDKSTPSNPAQVQVEVQV